MILEKKLSRPAPLSLSADTLPQLKQRKFCKPPNPVPKKTVRIFIQTWFLIPATDLFAFGKSRKEKIDETENGLSKTYCSGIFESYHDYRANGTHCLPQNFYKL